MVIIFLPINLNMCFGCSKEPYRDGSFEYPQHMFWMRTKENSFPIRTLICSPEMKDAAFTIGVAVMFPIMDMANKIIRNSDDKFHKFFISKVPTQ